MRFAPVPILCLTLLWACVGTSPAQPGGRSGASGPIVWVEEQLGRLTLEEKVAQMFSVWAGGYFLSADDPAYRQLVDLVENFGVGGVIFGVGEPMEQAALINDLQRRARIPLLVSQDMEWGAGMRLERATTLPHAMALGATSEPDYAYLAGSVTGVEARALGVHQILAPVADINNNPANPVINTRSFGERPDLVARMVSAFVRGAQAAGVIATIKHFPGHGDTDTDSHLGLPVLRVDRSRLDTLELVPFRAAIAAGVKSVMTGHLALPAVEPDTTVPATLSHAVTSGLLRETLGFEGLIVTDAMTMSGVSEHFDVGEAAVRAVEAGADMLLKSQDYYTARAAISNAARDGRLSEDRIDASVRRILRIKADMARNGRVMVDLEALREQVGRRRHCESAEAITRASLTLLRNRGRVLPLAPRDSSPILVITLSDTSDLDDGVPFVRALEQLATGGALSFLRLDPRSDDQAFADALTQAARHEVVLLSSLLRVRSGSGRIHLPEAQAAFLDRLIRTGPPVVVISFGNLYMAGALQQQPDAYLVAYGSESAAQRAAAEVIFGRGSTRGKLPVTIPGAYSYGDGIDLQQTTPSPTSVPPASATSRDQRW